MTTSAVYDLIPNEDGGQNTRYPLGDKPAAEVAPPVPTFLATSGETTTSIDLNWGQLGDDHTKFILQRWRLNTDTAWTTLIEPGKDDRNYTDSADLLEGQHVGYRIAASDGTNQSAWAPEAWTYVLRTPIEPGDAIMFDDFNSYTVGDDIQYEVPPVAAPGVRWNWSNSSFKDQPGCTVGTGGMDGGNCLDFNFAGVNDGGDNVDPGHSQAEQQLRLCDGQATAHRELWLEFYLKTTNVDRDQNGPQNDKFCAFHSVNYSDGGRPAYGRGGMYASLWPMGGNNYRTDLVLNQYDVYGNIYDNWSHPYADGGLPPYGIEREGTTIIGKGGPYGTDAYRNLQHADRLYNQNHQLISAAQAGTWVRYRVNMRQPSLGQSDGHGKIWKDDVLMYDITQMWRDSNYSYHQFMDGLYLMGYFNSGFLTATTWKVDLVTVWASDPGWTF